MNYAKASEMLGSRSSRKLENDTYLRREEDGTIRVRLHNTDVVSFSQDGSIVLATGGYRTVTTKDRIQKYAGVRISQSKGVWHTEYGVFQDRAEIYADGRTDGFLSNSSEVDTLRKKVRQYAKDFSEVLVTGKLDTNIDGDCFYCLMRTQDNVPLGEETKNTDHLLSHMDEKYYVVSLLLRAVEVSGAGVAWNWFIQDYLTGKLPAVANKWHKQQYVRFLVKYIDRQLGIG